jgi:twitching motility two-component system response regulator PilG
MTKLAGTKQSIQMAEAVAAAKLGRNDLARKLLREILERDPRSEQAWFWLAALAVDATEASDALVRVLEINPHNQRAMDVLATARLAEAGQRARREQRREAPAVQAKAAVAVATARPAAATAVAPVWRCPLWSGRSHVEERKCPRCGIILSLANLEELAQNAGVNEELIVTGVQELLARVEKSPSHEGHLTLALGYLNLNRSAEAVPHLKKAVALNPGLAGADRALAKLRSRPLILAVDDSSTVRKLVSISMERNGYRVLTAADGMQALAKLNEEVPDLVLLDITMPRMDGYQVCKVIKQNPYTKHIPVVMLSGKDGFFDKVKGRLAGATDYLTKPFPEDKLAVAVQKHLKKN